MKNARISVPSQKTANLQFGFELNLGTALPGGGGGRERGEMTWKQSSLTLEHRQVVFPSSSGHVLSGFTSWPSSDLERPQFCSLWPYDRCARGKLPLIAPN